MIRIANKGKNPIGTLAPGAEAWVKPEDAEKLLAGPLGARGVVVRVGASTPPAPAPAKKGRAAT